ncbi:MAG: cobyrinate a,c-diamide synthase [Firmicutes bacterium]|nr:cobyrinate a,c-diamide synthase [Bacillota bacterium]MCL5040384.1 cobyrinate a,c-diamide synthase [Bacillota bacterium]
MKTRQKLEPSIPSLILAAPHGRSGKTTVTLGLLLALRARGLVVQPFKKGPDFIDPSWLSLAANRLCRNLDAYFMERGPLLQTMLRGSLGADLAVIEGAMGLYDGLDLEGSGCTAEIAKLLAVPVVLVVDVTRMTRSVGALVMGYQHFDPNVKIAGVILNRVARSRHENMLRAAIEKYCGIPVLGAVPKEQGLSIPDRHLGLVPAAERGELDEVMQNLRAMGERYLDIDRLLQVARNQDASPSPGPAVEVLARPSQLDLWRQFFPEESGAGPGQAAREGEKGSDRRFSPGLAPRRTLLSGVSHRVRIGVFLDRVFTFYYPDNLEALIEAGAELVQINSLEDKELPLIDALYIGGGFPEVFGAELEANQGLRRDLAQAVENYLPVYAECGGLMYLGRRILWQGRERCMVGVLPFDTQIETKPQGHGYTQLEVTGANPFLSQGSFLRGHEFHNSRVVNLDGKSRLALAVHRGAGIDGQRDGIVYKNVLASYNHLHVAAAPEWADRLVTAAANYRCLAQETEPVTLRAAR